MKKNLPEVSRSSSTLDGEKPITWRWITHQRGDEHDHCILLPWGRRRIAVCARCAATYSAACITLALLLAVGLPPWGWLDHLWTLGASAPAIIDWGASRLGARSSNLRRLLTGTLLGIALGRSFTLYLLDSTHEVFWVHALVVVLTVVAVEIVRALDLGDL